jgi:hypothetical protein
VSQWDEQVIDPVERFIDRWTRDNNAVALNTLLPGWRSNFGLTDGWSGALDAVRTTAESDAVTPDERAVLQGVADHIKHALDHR